VKRIIEFLIKTIRNKSVVAWEHINLGGTYDFSDEALTNKFKFKKEQLLNVEILLPKQNP